MNRSISLACALAAAVALAAPATIAAAAQKAVPRDGSGSSSSPAPASGSGASTSSAPDSGSGSAGSRSDGNSPPPVRQAPAGARPTAVARRAAPAPGGVTSAAPASRSGESAGPAPVFGTARAIPRPPGSGVRTGQGRFVSFPFYGPWGNWYPWYTSGFGWDLGFVTYNPWRYGATGWVWGRYGMWYDPLAYEPYYGGESYLDYSGLDYSSRAPVRDIGLGSLRLRVSPSSAKVYVDGALVGVADEFDGLVHHLDIESGPHQLEFRADGYQSATLSVNVSAGKTATERVSLKKN